LGGERLGAAVAAAGDVNNDGYADAVVGNGAASGHGAVRLFLGGTTGFLGVPAWTSVGEQLGSSFGSVVAGAGDLDGDGYTDVLVSAPDFDGAVTDQGRVYVFLGSASGLATTPILMVDGDQAYMRLGSSLAAAGDVDGDGFDDFLVGAANFDASFPEAGRVLLFRGSPAGLSPLPAWSLEGSQEGELLGTSVAGAGDLDGDGFSDLVVGAPGYSGAVPNEGAIRVYRGSTLGPSTSPEVLITGGKSDSQFGVALERAGDINGDGLGDFLVGAPRFPNNGELSGRVFLYLGRESGLATRPAWIAQGFREVSAFGQSLAGGGDLNGDGYGDLMIGAAQFEASLLGVGQTLAYAGGAGAPSNEPSVTIQEESAGSLIGASLCDAGDVNGDGFSDVLAGAFTHTGAYFEGGKALLFLGSVTGLQTSPTWSFEGSQTRMWFGRSTSSAGDVNGDGFDDLIVGAPYFDNGQSDEGAVFVFAGSQSGPSIFPSWLIEGNQPYAQFGWSVSSAGDVNGDGYADVIVGADQYSGSQGRSGAAFLHLGSPSGVLDTPSWGVLSDQNGADLGSTVVGAGDVNGDGYSDVLVGAPGYDIPGNPDENWGRLYLYYGGPTGLTSMPAWVKDGSRLADNFGYAAASVGDANGDGFADILVGSIGYDPCRVLLYQGSPSGLASSPQWTFQSDQANTGLGVSSAGDLNGDGFSDVAIGLYNYTASIVSQGRTYLIYGSPTGLEAHPAWVSDGLTEEGYFGLDTTSGGDVNGDGYGDLLIGAKTYFNVYNGNDGGSAVLRASQRRTDGRPISRLGRSDLLDGFTISAVYTPPTDVPMHGSSPTEAWLEWETAAQGATFDGVPEGRGPRRPLQAGPNSFEERVTGLFGDLPYSWRVRVVTEGPSLPPTPWYSIHGRSSIEPKIRIGRSGLRRDH
jgi:hypothetical protein